MPPKAAANGPGASKKKAVKSEGPEEEHLIIERQLRHQLRT